MVTNGGKRDNNKRYATKKEILIIQLRNVVCSSVTSLHEPI